MLSGALIGIPENFTVEQLDGLLWEREESGFELRSVIQLERHLLVERGVAAREALAIHQGIGTMPELEVREGRYTITFASYVRTISSHIYVLPTLVVADNLTSRGFVREIINKGLRQANLAYNLTLDTARMAKDHRNHWIRRFTDRRGRVSKGALYGDGVEQDSVFGPELNRSRTRAVGWFTNFFGSLDKVKVSPKGSVTLWANPPVELFLRFLRYEILPYVVALP